LNILDLRLVNFGLGLGEVAGGDVDADDEALVANDFTGGDRDESGACGDIEDGLSGLGWGVLEMADGPIVGTIVVVVGAVGVEGGDALLVGG
jgi:hypothetical protein